ncbi:MAG TPA: glycerol-3-phosphate 1-O-acyltransferase PlsY [Candidatus Baltobacteraceae bacterium]|nr:glycerol-3-phosphate 1-O-acyltransferase PlsY [Candidatus Baltobacteraceae bacterium]
MAIGVYIFVVVVSYVLGSTPSGYLAGMVRGIDIRTVGSGNIGATNVFRVLGRTAGIAVLIADGLKGFVAARFVPALALHIFTASGARREGLSLAAGVGAILGHNYSCWLRFKGGKGIATSGGVVMAWAPQACLTALGVWGVVILITRYVSLASIAAAVTLPFAVWLWKGSPTMTYVMSALSLLAIYKHKGNIQRLLKGTENRIGKKKN